MKEGVFRRQYLPFQIEAGDAADVFFVAIAIYGAGQERRSVDLPSDQERIAAGVDGKLHRDDLPHGDQCEGRHSLELLFGERPIDDPFEIDAAGFLGEVAFVFRPPAEGRIHGVFFGLQEVDRSEVAIIASQEVGDSQLAAGPKLLGAVWVIDFLGVKADLAFICLISAKYQAVQKIGVIALKPGFLADEGPVLQVSVEFQRHDFFCSKSGE